MATVIDIASRRVVGFAMAEHLRIELVADALTNAVAARDPAPGVIFHADRGCQYTSGDYAMLAGDLRGDLVDGADRATGQRAGRIVLRLAEGRVPGPAAPGRPGRRPPGHRRASPGTTAPACTARSATRRPTSSKPQLTGRPSREQPGRATSPVRQSGQPHRASQRAAGAIAQCALASWRVVTRELWLLGEAYQFRWAVPTFLVPVGGARMTHTLPIKGAR